MILAERVSASVAGLGFAAADVAARSAEPEVERGAALLAGISGRGRDDLGGVRTGRSVRRLR